MSPGFQVFKDARGDLSMADGVVIDRSTGVATIVGSASALGVDVSGGTAASFSDAMALPNASDLTLLGGSGRNVIVSGPPDIAGIYRASRPGLWESGEFILEVFGSSSAEIRDAIDTVAVLTTGGNAPGGSYNSTSYGVETYNGGSGFTATGAKETGWPGAVPEIEIEVSDGTARPGRFASTDGVTWTHLDDPDWSITVAVDGSAEYSYNGSVIARRESGPDDDPCGLYLATEAGLVFNPEFPEAEEAEPAETNPFGVLTMTISWGGAPDLDIGCTFLGETVGFGYDGDVTYLDWSGDDTSAAGSETVIVNLNQAWVDGVIATVADIHFAADWYPPRDGSGPATLTVTYDPPGSTGTPVVHTVHPGSTSPSSTPVLALRVTAAGVVEPVGTEWFATVAALHRPTVEGVAYITLDEAGGEVAGVSGPFFSATLPSSSGSLVHFPIATSDGSGNLKQIHTGPLLWTPSGGGGGGAAFVEITEDDYLDLDPPDSATYYDLTDLIP